MKGSLRACFELQRNEVEGRSSHSPTLLNAFESNDHFLVGSSALASPAAKAAAAEENRHHLAI